MIRNYSLNLDRGVTLDRGVSLEEERRGIEVHVASFYNEDAKV